MLHQPQTQNEFFNTVGGELHTNPYIRLFINSCISQQKGQTAVTDNTRDYLILNTKTGYIKCQPRWAEIDQKAIDGKYNAAEYQKDWLRLPPTAIYDLINNPLLNNYVTTLELLQTISLTHWAIVEPSMFDVLRSWILHVIVPSRKEKQTSTSLYVNKICYNLHDPVVTTTPKQLQARLLDGGFELFTDARYAKLCTGDYASRS